MHQDINRKQNNFGAKYRNEENNRIAEWINSIERVGNTRRSQFTQSSIQKISYCKNQAHDAIHR